VPDQQSPIGVKIIEALERLQMRLKTLGIYDGLGQQAHGAKQVRTRNDQLEASPGVLKEEMLRWTVCQ